MLDIRDGADATTPTLMTGVMRVARVVTEVIAPRRFSMTLRVGSAVPFQVPPRNVTVFVTAAGLRDATALCAGYLAARRVTRSDALLAMREE